MAPFDFSVFIDSLTIKELMFLSKLSIIYSYPERHKKGQIRVFLSYAGNL